MKVVFSSHGWEDYQYWVINDPTTLRRVNDLIEQCRRTPFKGTGKPEPLKGSLHGWWSRRVTASDRLVYRIEGSGAEQRIEIAQCRFHYD